MSTKSDNNIRRSSRIHDKKRYTQISYRELEEGKDYIMEESFDEKPPHQDIDIKAETKGKSKTELKLSHPKKSLTAYTLFVKIKRKELQEKFPDATTPELMKEIGRQWKSISPGDKEWYQNMALKDKERYKKEIDQMNKLKEFHGVEGHDLKKPKKCLSSYMIFVRDTRSKVTQEFPDMNALDVMKEVGRRWQSITKDNKDYFQALADKDKERFKRENQQYLKDLDNLDKKLKSSNNGKPFQFGEDEDEGKEAELYSKPEPAKEQGKKAAKAESSDSKKSSSAYVLYIEETRKKAIQDAQRGKIRTEDIEEVMRDASERWSKMSQAERHPYVISVKNNTKKRDEKGPSKTNNIKIDTKTSKMVNEDEFNFQQYYDVDSELDKQGRKRKKASDDDESWSKAHKGSAKKKANNKVSINITSVEKKNANSRPPMRETEDPISVDEPKFYFNQPSNKQPNEPIRQPNPPMLNKQNSNGFVNNNMPNPDTVSGSTTNKSFMSKPYMFSPTPFAPNRSPGVSPNMMARFSPFMGNPMDNQSDYLNRSGNTPSVMGQRNDEPYSNMMNNQKGNVNFTPQQMMQSPAINPFGGYGMPNASPSGFTPIRTNFQRQSPMFSPANVDYGQYFNTSPNINCMSNSSFGYPANNPFRRPNMQAQPKPNMNNKGGKSTNEKDIFALNPFDS